MEVCGSVTFVKVRKSQFVVHCCAGQLLAMRISQRSVAVSGGILFLLFAANNALRFKT